MPPTPGTFLGTLLGFLVFALGAGLLALMGYGATLLARRAKESTVARLAAHAFDLAQSVVAHIEAEMRPKLVTALADGRLTPEERLALKEQAMRLLKDALAAEGLKKLEKVRGLAGPTLEVYLSGLLERALGSQRAVFVPRLAKVAPPNP